MSMKYKSSEPNLPKKYSFIYLFIQQMFAEYLLCSSICCNDELQKMVPALGS